MRSTGNHTLRAKATNRLPSGIESRIGRELRLGSTVTIRRVHFRQMNSHRGYIRRAEFNVAKIVIDSRGVTGDVSIAKISCDPNNRKKLRLIPRRDRGQIPLEAVQIDF